VNQSTKTEKKSDKVSRPSLMALQPDNPLERRLGLLERKMDKVAGSKSFSKASKESRKRETRLKKQEESEEKRRAKLEEMNKNKNNYHHRASNNESVESYNSFLRDPDRLSKLRKQHSFSSSSPSKQKKKELYIERQEHIDELLIEANKLG